MAAIARGTGRALFSVRKPTRRVWPPPENAPPLSWIQRWVVPTVMTVGIPAVAIFDWNSFVFNCPARYAAAVPLMGVSILGALAHRRLGAVESLGHTDTGGRLVLETEGLYRLSRNPQYVGAAIGNLGIVIASNSLLAGISTCCMIGMFVANIFAEESWLRERFGADYDEYCRTVPRFLGVRRPATE